MNLVFLSNQLTQKHDKTDNAIISILKQRNSNTISYIPSQADKDRHFFNLVKSYYNRIGLAVYNYFDLDIEYDENKIPEILKSGAIHLSGGSTYHFLQNIQRRNFLPILKKYVADGGVLIGVSAGAIVMTPSVDTSQLCGDQVINEISTQGLNLSDWEFIPHLHSIPGLEEKTLEYSKKSKNRIFACDDGEGIIVTDKDIQFIGNVREYYRGKCKIIN
jgi:dipeptidase E